MKAAQNTAAAPSVRGFAKAILKDVESATKKSDHYESGKPPRKCARARCVRPEREHATLDACWTNPVRMPQSSGESR